MTIRYFLLSVFAVLVMAVPLKAQNGDNTAYFLSNMPQQFRLNPAYQPEYKVFIGLPGLSGISVNYLNSSFGVEDLLRKSNDSVHIDLNKFYKSLHKRNFINFSNTNSILSIGVKAKSWYGTLDITQRNDFMFSYRKDLFTFLKEGNTNHPDMDFGKLGLNGNSYMEIALGLSKVVNSKLTVGARAKYLAGIANVDMTDSEMGITTDAEGSLLLHSRQNIRMSAPVDLRYKTINGYVDWDSFDVNTDDISVSSVLNAKNPGFAMDFGGQYKLTDKITLFASLTDLGFIHWGNKDNTYTLKQDASFKWDGVDISNSINDKNSGYRDLDDAFDDLIDQMDTTFRFTEGGKSYTTMLSPKLHLGATYQFHRMLNVGGLVKATLVDGMFIPSLTASANARLLRNVSASVSYTVTRGNYVNIGAGITAKLGPVQLYVTTDNALAGNYTKTRAMSAQVGINLLFGHKDKKKKVKEEVKPEEIMIAPEPIRDTVAKDTVLTQPDPTPADSVVREENVVSVNGDTVKAFYVIVGSFNSKERAESLKAQLPELGFKSGEILRNDLGMYRVSAESCESHEACWQEVFKIRKQYSRFRDAWGLTAKR